MIKAVIFDFGKVIWKFDNDVFFGKLAENSEKSLSDIRDWYVLSDIEERYETGNITFDEFFKEVAEKCNVSISKEGFLKAYTGMFTPIQTTIDLIRGLNSKYRLALLSNTSDAHFEHVIKKSGVFDLFETVTLSYEVGVMKPGKEIWEDALQKLGLKPEECAYIDDKKEYSDIATEMGIHGIYYIGYEKLVEDLRKTGVRF